MRVRSITTCALGLAAALPFASTLAAQQDTTKLRKTTQSSQRIPISKESPGEVVTVRVDTVYVTRYDTVRTTLSRVDTVTVTPPPALVIPKVRAMYWGLAAGPTRPYGNIDRIYTNGFHGEGVLGWESQQSPIGLRLDGGVSQVGREETLISGGGLTANQVGSGTPLWMHLAADLKIKPVNMSGWALYLLGGLNINRYRGMALTSSNSQGPNDFFIRGESFENASTSWQNAVGFNFGVGTDFHIGNQDMFIEYRYIAARSNKSNSYLNPISVGVRYF